MGIPRYSRRVSPVEVAVPRVARLVRIQREPLPLERAGRLVNAAALAVLAIAVLAIAVLVIVLLWSRRRPQSQTFADR